MKRKKTMEMKRYGKDRNKNRNSGGAKQSFVQ